MNKAECPIDELELGRLLDGELTENRARDVRQHLGGCAACTRRLGHHQTLVGRLRAPVPGALDPGFVDEVERRLPTAAVVPLARRRRVLLAAPALVAAAAAVALVAVPRGEVDSRFAARGGKAPWHERVSTALALVPADKATPPRPIVAGTGLHAGDGIAVSARNGNPDRPVYLMVFAVDAQGEVHWIVPAWSDPAENPGSVRLAPEQALPEPTGRTPDAPAAGKLQLQALLSANPLDVRAVEAQLRAHRPLTTADRHLRTVEVEMLHTP